jgi:hypothetical protein
MFQRVVMNIFDVRTGKVMRDFKGSADEFSVGGTGGVTGVSWPAFRLFFCFSVYINLLISLYPFSDCVTIFSITH